MNAQLRVCTGNHSAAHFKWTHFISVKLLSTQQLNISNFPQPSLTHAWPCVGHAACILPEVGSPVLLFSQMRQVSLREGRGLPVSGKARQPVHVSLLLEWHPQHWGLWAAGLHCVLPLGAAPAICPPHPEEPTPRPPQGRPLRAGVPSFAPRWTPTGRERCR